MPKHRSLTASEEEKLPHCPWSWDQGQKCDEEKGVPDNIKGCIRCTMEAMHEALVHPPMGNVDAMHALDGLAEMLKKEGLLE